MSKLTAQEYYWTFEGENGLVDTKKGEKLFTEWKKIDLSKDPDGRSFLRIKPIGTNRVKFCKVPAQRQFSMEFLIRYDVENLGFDPLVFDASYPSFKFYLNNSYIGFATYHEEGGSSKVIRSMAAMGDLGRRSLSYYFDNQWHHIAIVFDGLKGEGITYVDGEPIARNQESLKGLKLGDKSFWINTAPKFTGDLDHLAVYFRPLSQKEVIEHAAAALANKTYGTSVRQKNFPPTASQQKESIDLQEFAPKHPSVSLSPIQQLDQFPYPRYKSNHQLMPLVNWMGIPFIGGYKQEGISLPQAAQNTADITELMGDKFHYYLMISNSKEVRVGKSLEDQYVVVKEMVELANRRKDLPLSVISLWMQTNLILAGEEKMTPFIVRRDLPDSYYLQSSKGQYLKLDGGPAGNRRWLSPAAPATLFRKDGSVQKQYFTHLLNLLDRPIDLINENGETPPPKWLPSTPEFDPKVKAHFQKSGIKDWDSYSAAQKLRFRRYYSEQFVNNIKGLDNTLFTWYAVDGGPVDRFQWKNARLIHSKINGQYYSTPDFYPRNPQNWRKWTGAWHGWEWLVQCRQVELKEGDRLFSPFVAAGWALNPEKNIRPTQWLGLLKLMGPIGAEFFYTGFFNETPWNVQGKPVFANPKNYIWQAAIPSYAQAITSHYEDILRDGDLLKDDKNNPMVNIPLKDPRFLVSMRKAKDAKRYIIAGAILPSSNIKGQVPDQESIWVPIEGKKYRLMFRRQGSVYDLDLSGSQPVIRQLDSWHETGHPIYWSKDLFFEAEVFDEAEGAKIHTEIMTPNSTVDFSEFTSWACVEKKKARLTYHFIPSETNSRFLLKLKARNAAMGRNQVKVWVNGKEKGSMAIKQSNWKEYELDLGGRFEKGKKNKLVLEVQSEGLELDSFTLKKN